MATDNKLLSYIVSDGKKQAEEILKNAEKKSGEIILEAERKAEENAKEIAQAASLKAQNLRNIAKSNASLVSRNAVLKAKREQIDLTVDGIKNRILSLDGSDYFDFVYRLAFGLSADNGEILMNERDLKRLPKDFEEKLASNGIRAKVSKNPADISGGFILREGQVEINCSLDSIIDDRRNELEDFINTSIFEQGENGNA